MTQTNVLPADADDPAVLLAVDRATAELRRGGPVVLHDQKSQAWLTAAAETVEDDGVARLRAMGEGEPHLLLTSERAAALGLRQQATGIESLLLPARLSAETLWRLADPTAPRLSATFAGLSRGRTPAHIALAAIELAKLARLLPAAIIAPLRLESAVRAAEWARSRDLLDVSVGAVDGYQVAAARSLKIVSEARVPLAGAENARVIAFRPSDGGTEHLAIIIGEPPRDRPALTRLHSECFTGDLLGSLRCDCGDQLRGAIAEIARHGNGLLIYLAQEGRGIGLVNKLRAYRLQDQGADTFEANEQLGFDADERIYLPAAEMLRQLGFREVRLMTNNPAKMTALAHCGIAVVERVPHVFPANSHNDRYLETKAVKFGHLF
ncbi:MAG: GTP cyclohydrolase II [Dongiaceae bacterium]